VDKIKALLFDLDGVIVSTEKNHFHAWQKTAQKLGVDFREEQNEELKGVNRVDSLKKILSFGNLKVSKQVFEQLLSFKNEVYLESIRNLNRKDLLPGVLNLLNEAKSNRLKIGLGSSSKNARLILELLELTDLFDVIIDGNSVTYPKPHPEVFLNGAQLLGLSPKQCLVFEDAASGIQAAKDGGFYAIAVGNKTIETLADLYIEDLTNFTLVNYA